MIDSTTAGLNANIPPEPTKGIAGGSYFVPGSHSMRSLALGTTPNSSRVGSFVEDTPEGLKKGTQAGKGSFRETGPYLDRPISGRRPDPPTTFVSWFFRSPFRRKVFSFIFYNSQRGSARLVTSSRGLLNVLVDSTTAGVDARIAPVRTPQGAGGSYYMPDALGEPAGVYKPSNEEPKAVKNPEQQQSKEGNEGTPEGLKPGTKAGKGCVREVAAYLLDHPISGRRPHNDDPCGFAGVPPTTFGCTHDVPFKNPPDTKEGSLQMYMKNDGDCKNIDSDVYNKFPKDEVHKIAVLDIRLANADRHGGNILWSNWKSMNINDNSLWVKLIPIDHGYCLPDKFRGDKFVWLTWPQAKQPFSPETIKYIETLDAEKDIDFLKEFIGWDMPLLVARVFRVSTMLLKEGAKKNLTPHAIGKSMRRNKNNREGTIEKFFNEASKKFPLKEDDSEFINTVSAKIDSHLDEIAKRLRSDISLKIGTPS